jgi:RNA polymerase-binding transcription factor DksA
MTKAETEVFQTRLLALKKRLGADLSQLEEEALHGVGGEAGGGLSGVPIHPADLGTETFEEEMDLELAENEDRLLTEVNDALARLEQGTFGACENCHRAIPRERLKVLPYARYCVQCAKADET